MLQLGVRPDIGRVLAAQLQAEADEARGGGPLNRVAGRHRAGEGNEVEAVMADQIERRLVAQVQVLEQPLGQPGGREGLGEALGRERRLGRVLEDHPIAGHERRHDGVDRGQVGIVPGRDDQDHAERLAPHEAGEAVPRLRAHIGQRLGRHLDHIAGPFLEAGDLARALAARPAHLPGDFLGDLAALGDEGVDRLAKQRLALGNRQMAPGRLRLTGADQGRPDFGRAGQRPLDIDAAVDRRDAFQRFAHASPSPTTPPFPRL